MSIRKQKSEGNGECGMDTGQEPKLSRDQDKKFDKPRNLNIYDLK